MDLVMTPTTHSFAMLDITGVDTSKRYAGDYPSGRIAMETTLLYEKNVLPAVLDHIFALADEQPEIQVGEFKDFILGIEIPKEYISELLSEERLNETATQHMERYEDSTFKAAYDHVRSMMALSTWRQVIKQQGENFLPYNKEIVGAVKYSDGEFRLADHIGQGNNGHGPFEISVFDAIYTSETEGTIYPVKTLELKLREKITGSGVNDFAEKF